MRSGGVGIQGVRGHDLSKRVVGRKCNALPYTDDSLLMASASPDDAHDSYGGIALLRAQRQLKPFLAPFALATMSASTGRRAGITLKLVTG